MSGNSSSVAAVEPSSQTGFLRALLRVARSRKAVAFGLTILIVFSAMAVFAPWFSGLDPNAMAVSQRLKAPGMAFWLGSDEFGRDVYTRVIYGGRISLLVGFMTVLLAGSIGVVLGVAAGFFPKFDSLLTKVIDAMMAFPDILLAIALVSALGPSVVNVVLALGIAYTPRVARVVRASTLVIRELPYVEAARALGITTPRIIRTHVLRNLASPIIVQGTFIFAHAILAESGLSFLGVGVSPETPTWGMIVNAGQQFSREAPWLMLFPGLAIVMSVFSLQMVGDSLRDVLDPRMAKDL